MKVGKREVFSPVVLELETAKELIAIRTALQCSLKYCRKEDALNTDIYISIIEQVLARLRSA